MFAKQTVHRSVEDGKRLMGTLKQLYIMFDGGVRQEENHANTHPPPAGINSILLIFWPGAGRLIGLFPLHHPFITVLRFASQG